jgi:hypothetical protein
MNLEEIVEAIKVNYDGHDDLDEMVSDLSDGGYIDHWANKFCEEDYPQNLDLAKELYAVSVENAESGADYASVAQSIADTGGLNNKKWAEELYIKAIELTDDTADMLSIIDDVADETYLNNKEWARELYTQTEPNLSELFHYISLRNGLEERLEDKEWAKQVSLKAVDFIKKSDDVTEIAYDEVIDVANYLAYEEQGNDLELAKDIYNYLKEYESVTALIEAAREVKNNYDEDAEYRDGYINYCVERAIEFVDDDEYCDVYSFIKDDLEDDDKADEFKDNNYDNMEREYKEYGSCEELFKEEIEIQTDTTGYFKLTITATGGEFSYGMIEDEDKINLIRKKIEDGEISLENEGEDVSVNFYDCDTQIIQNYGPVSEGSYIDLSVYEDEECESEIEEIVNNEAIDSISLNVFSKSNPYFTPDMKEEFNDDALQFGGYYYEKRVALPAIIHIEDGEVFDITNVYVGTTNMDETLSNDEVVDSVLYIRPEIAQQIMDIYDDELEDEPLSDYLSEIYDGIRDGEYLEAEELLRECECEILDIEGKGEREEMFVVVKTLDDETLFDGEV